MMEFTKSIPGQNYSATISLTDNVLVLKICGVDEKYEKKFVTSTTFNLPGRVKNEARSLLVSPRQLFGMLCNSFVENESIYVNTTKNLQYIQANFTINHEGEKSRIDFGNIPRFN